MEADKYPCTGNEDVPVAIAITGDALEKARTAVLPADEPPEFARWLRELQRLDLTSNEREEIIWALYDYFEPGDQIMIGSEITRFQWVDRPTSRLLDMRHVSHYIHS